MKVGHVSDVFLLLACICSNECGRGRWRKTLLKNVMGSVGALHSSLAFALDENLLLARTSPLSITGVVRMPRGPRGAPRVAPGVFVGDWQRLGGLDGAAWS